jgi:cobalt-zinc-cadmium efflux system outer membrane protein
MCFKYLSFFLILLLLAFGITGCATHPIEAVLPEYRPVGKDLPAYQAPRQPSAASELPKIKEPPDVLTLQEALALALMKNPALATFSWEVRAKEAQTLQAGLFPNPELSFEAEDFGGSKELQNFHEADFTLRLSQLIELGGKRSKRMRVAALEGNLEGWNYKTKRIDVLTEVTKAFIDVLSAQEQLSLAEELVSLSGQVLNTVSARVKAGKVSPIEKTKASITLSTSQFKLARAKQELVAARKRLVANWGDTSATFKKVKGDLYTTTSIPSVEQLIEYISKNPDIARWATEIQRQQAVVTLEESKKIPDLTLTGGVRHKNAVDDNVFVAEISIPIPIFNRNQGDTLAAKHRLAKAKEEKRAMSLQVRTTLVDAYKRLSTASTEVNILKEKVLTGAQDTFEKVREGYRQGKFALLDVLDAQRTLFEAKGQYTETLTAYHKAIADIKRLIGWSD